MPTPYNHNLSNAQFSAEFGNQFIIPSPINNITDKLKDDIGRSVGRNTAEQIDLKAIPSTDMRNYVYIDIYNPSTDKLLVDTDMKASQAIRDSLLKQFQNKYGQDAAILPETIQTDDPKLKEKYSMFNGSVLVHVGALEAYAKEHNISKRPKIVAQGLDGVQLAGNYPTITAMQEQGKPTSTPTIAPDKGIQIT